VEQQGNIEELRSRIIYQIADLSRLLGTIQSDESDVHEARTSFLKLSVLVGEALGINVTP